MNQNVRADAAAATRTLLLNREPPTPRKMHKAEQFSPERCGRRVAPYMRTIIAKRNLDANQDGDLCIGVGKLRKLYENKIY